MTPELSRITSGHATRQRDQTGARHGLGDISPARAWVESSTGGAVTMVFKNSGFCGGLV